MTTAFETLAERGVLSPLDRHFAQTLGRIGGEQHPLVLLATALASRAVGQGHVCLDLSRLIEGGALVDDTGVPVTCAWPARREWLPVLRQSPLVGAPGSEANTPLVLDEHGRLYLRRYWLHQTRLAAAVRARAAIEEPVDTRSLMDGVRRLFPDQPVATTGAHRRAGGAASREPDWQCVAALTAVLRRFCIISGGPGTGKTHTVVRILALLVEQALAAERRPPRITLLAPTGKAAARLAEAIRAGKATLPCADAVIAAIPDTAATIHRGLGAMPGRSTMFRHGPDSPLLADVVLVDEASMIDLALMARLSGAIAPATRLILLGDQDQLASVEAGAVLGDLCNTGGTRARSRPFNERLAALGVAVPSAPDAPDHPGIWDTIVQLTRSYRYDAGSNIARVAQAVNAGDVDATEQALAAGPAVRCVEPDPDGALGAPLERAVLDGFAPYLAAADPLAALQALGRFRVLCAHRRGRFGAEVVNAQIEQLLAAAGRLRPARQWYDRRPILITRNDYQLQLFNGDVGLIVEDRNRPGEHRAVFAGPDGAIREVAPSRLPPHETVFAMTVHKSQGSEFDAVAVVMPADPSPIVSRELLYTAITRARREVLVVAGRSVLAHAVTYRVERASGLRDALWAS